MDEDLSTGIDRLRALSIVGVVCIHATSPLLNERAGRAAHDGLFWGLAALNQAARFSVPAFFFLAGLLAAIASRRVPAGGPAGTASVGARLRRLLLPYLTWSVALFVVPEWLRRGALPPGTTTRFLLGQTFTGGYFLIALAQLALVTPWLCRRAGTRRRETALAAAVLLAAVLGGDLIAAYGGPSPWAIIINSGFSAALSSGLVWAPFFMAGVLGGFDPARLRSFLLRRAGWFVVLAAMALPLCLVEFRITLERTGSIGLAASFLKPSSVALAVACTGLALVVPAGPAVSRIARWLAPASFAIYLVHGGVIQAMERVLPGPGDSAAAAWLDVAIMVLAGLAAPMALYRFAARRLPAPLNLLLFGRAGPRHAAGSDAGGAGRFNRSVASGASPSWSGTAS